ncbi:MAG: metallophosphoesterase [Candidatus Omnitrophica bacterium]|nr:metallophosphoesterase [Candidatus Omnitrophota bacterium]
MKVVVLSDTHIPYAAEDLPKPVYHELESADVILHAGDFVEEAVLDKLKKITKTYAVRGNMDSAQLRQLLKDRLVIELGSFRIGLIHGSGSPASLLDFVSSAFKGEKVDAVVFGHSHYPINEKKEGILFFNPGSSTDKVFATYRSFGILEIGDDIKGRIVRL